MGPDLGKYAFHVLTSYGAVALALGGLVLLSLRADRKARRQLAEAEAAQSGKGQGNGRV